MTSCYGLKNKQSLKQNYLIYVLRFEATVDGLKTSGDTFSSRSIVTDGLFFTAVIQLCT